MDDHRLRIGNHGLSLSVCMQILRSSPAIWPIRYISRRIAKQHPQQAHWHTLAVNSIYTLTELVTTIMRNIRNDVTSVTYLDDLLKFGEHHIAIMKITMTKAQLSTLRESQLLFLQTLNIYDISSTMCRNIKVDNIEPLIHIQLQIPSE